MGHYAGTLITNFLGPYRLAGEISSICTGRLLEGHPFGREVLGCGWILSFAMLRIIVEQLDFAFELFDPVDQSPGVRVYLYPHVNVADINHSLPASLVSMTYPQSWKRRIISPESIDISVAWKN
jgi:hypothetical protein